MSSKATVLSIDSVGKNQESSSVAVASAVEQIRKIAEGAYTIAANCASNAQVAGLTMKEACQATANGILTMLDGEGMTDIPSFDLTPVPYNPHNYDRSFTTWDENDVTRDVEWGYGVRITTAGVLRQAHAQVYDELRDRLSISAKDLFS
jgi:hypothetical protein